MIVVQPSRSVTPASSRRCRAPGLKGLAATGILASALVATTNCNAECFTAEYPAKIDYQYQADLISPISGVVVWAPRIGYAYAPIMFDRPADSGPNYIIPNDQSKDVVAYISNDPIWVRRVLADNDRRTASDMKPTADLMIRWQNKMRVHEDYLFTLQQGQDIPVRWYNYKQGLVEEAVRRFADRDYPELLKFPPAVPYDAKKESVRLRSDYSDYMRGIELKKLREATENALTQAELRSRLADGDAETGKVTCPIQCYVFESAVTQGRRVNAGDKLASVASVHHKKALITLPANHVVLQLKQDSTMYDVTLTQPMRQMSVKTLALLPDDRSATPLQLNGMIVGVPKRSQTGDLVDIEVKLDDPQGNDRTMSTLTGDTKIRIIPTEYAKASADDRSKIEEKVSKLGLTCQ